MKPGINLVGTHDVPDTTVEQI